MLQKIEISGFQYSKIILIESLEDHEFKVCTNLALYINSLQEESRQKLTIEQISCESAYEFIAIIRRIADIHPNESIIINVDCHGDKNEGLHFANSSVLSWPDFSEELTKLNIKTNMGILLIVSACYGYYIMSQNKPFRRAPFWGVIAPTEIVDPSEIYRSLMKFYRCIINNSTFEKSFSILKQENLTCGKWVAEFSERWFYFQSLNYLTQHANNEIIKARTIKIHENFPEIPIGKIRSLLRKEHKDGMSQYFENYFLCDIYPTNKERFFRVHTRISKLLTELRKRGFLYI